MSYQGEPGGPRDPSMPGGYCLSRCFCGACPQYAEQERQVAALRDQEYQARDRREGERAAQRTRRGARKPTPTEREEDQ